MTASIIHFSKTSFSYTSYDNLVSQFLKNQDVKETTKHGYTTALKVFRNWLVNNSMEFHENLQASDILKFKNDLLASETVTSGTINLYLVGLRQFYRHLELHEGYKDIARPIRSLKVSRKHGREALTKEQVDKLLFNTMVDASLRDFAIVNLIVRTGLRISEVANIRFQDLKEKYGRLLLYVQGKGTDDKSQFVILSKHTFAPIKKYVDEERSKGQKIKVKPTDYVFLSVRDGKLSNRSMSHICKKALRSAGIDDPAYSAHSLRHTAACNLLKAGAQIEDVQSVLRHSSVDTTRIYLETIAEEHRINNFSEARLDEVYSLPSKEFEAAEEPRQSFL